MKEHPILFSAPMVRALAGTKTQTRRIVKPQPDPAAVRAEVVGQWCHFEDEAGPPNERGNREGRMWTVRCSHGAPGDRLWVRERMRVLSVAADGGEVDSVRVRYEADGTEALVPYPNRLAPPRVDRCLAYGGHREASRIDLEVTAVRVERLQAITEEDIAAEGVTRESVEALLGRTVSEPLGASPVGLWSLGWDAINGERAAWASNPWVWVVNFRRVRP